MVTSGTVNSSLDKFLSDMDDYSSNIESLSGSWKGASHDKLEEQATSFASRFKDSLENHFTTFAEACDLYKEYEEEKEAIEKLEVKRDDEYSSWQSAKNNDNDISAAWHHANYVSYRNEVNRRTEEQKELKKRINALLDKVTALVDSRASAKGTTPAPAKEEPEEKTGRNPNIEYSKDINDDKLYISSKNGYVFPIEKGVSAPVTSSVGYRTPPNSGATSNHQGTDIGVSSGTKVYSLCDGEVVAVGEDGGYGQRVKIKQSDGSTVIYAHLSKSDYYSEGDKVYAGDVIALSGSTGNATGPHLHLEIHDEDGNLVDSEEIFNDNDSWPGDNS